MEGFITNIYIYIHTHIYIDLHCNLKIVIFKISLSRAFEAVRDKPALGFVI
jgi:hypothetical protein